MAGGGRCALDRGCSAPLNRRSASVGRLTLEGRLEKLAYTIPEAIAVSGIRRAALYKEIKEGHLEIRKRGSTTLILAEELRRYLSSLPLGGDE